MRRRSRVGTEVLAVLGLSVFPLSASFGQSADVFEGPVPRAVCGPGSRPETGLGGQVPLADRDSGRSARGYWCNLTVTGRFGPGEGLFEGAAWQMAWYGHCAYYDTRLGGTQDRRGTIVVDVSDPAQPRYSTNLITAAMQDPWESLKVNQERGLLAGVFAGGIEGAAFFDVYDVKTDCAHPRLLASVPVNGLGHEGDWAPDGRTYYATGCCYTPVVTAIDVGDPARPRPITAFAVASDVHGVGTGLHGLGVSADGRRLYLAHVPPDWPTLFVDSRPNATAANGLGVYDISQIQGRVPEPGDPAGRVGAVERRPGRPTRHPVHQRRPSLRAVRRRGRPRRSPDHRYLRRAAAPGPHQAEDRDPDAREPRDGQPRHPPPPEGEQRPPLRLRLREPLLQPRPARGPDHRRLFRVPVRLACLRHPRHPPAPGDRLLQPRGRRHRRPPAPTAAPSPASPRPNRGSSPNGRRSGSPTRTAASTSCASPTAPGRSVLRRSSDRR